MLERKSAVPRIHPATDNGKVDGTPVFLTREVLAEKRRKQGPYTFACQMLQDPKADESQGFNPEWIRYWDTFALEMLNVYIIVDSANEKHKASDYTAMMVVGLGRDQNYYVLDMIRDRINLTERTQTLIMLHKTWKPIGVIYEKYGKDSDIQHIEFVQDRLSYRFEITPVGGATPKNDRIRRLIPIFEQKRIFFPRGLMKQNYEGMTENLVNIFIQQEYTPFPVMFHDDMLDCLARIADPNLEFVFPVVERKPVVLTQAEQDWQEIIGADSSIAYNIQDF